MRVLLLSVVKPEPVTRTGRQGAQMNGVEKGNRWPEHVPFVVRVGGGVGCTCLLGGGFASGAGWCVLLLAPSKVMGGPDVRAERWMAQKDGAEMGEKWPGRQAFVARVGRGVGCTCLLGGDFASGGGGGVRVLPLSVVKLEPVIRTGR